MSRVLQHPAIRIPAVYLLVALPWVLLTDLFVRLVSPSVAVENVLQSTKGAAFVVVTTVLLGVSISRSWSAVTRARHRAEENEAQYRGLVSSLDDLVFVLDTELLFVDLLGPLSTDENRHAVLGREAHRMFSDDVAPRYRAKMEQVLGGETLAVDWFRTKAPTIFPLDPDVSSMHIVMTPLRDAHNVVIGVVGVGRDTSKLHDLERERQQAEHHISFLVNYDPLTGLPNRSLFETRCAEALADGDGAGIAIHLLDLTSFKDVNDSLGFGVGDALLRSVAEYLQAPLGSDDTIARLTGDEFVVLQRGVDDVAHAEAYARHLLAVFDAPIPADGQDIYVSASLGIAMYPADGADASTLLRAAESAMYQAKELPDGRYAFFNSQLAEAARERLALANELREALKTGEMWVAYQPIIDPISSRIVAFEALARWRSPSRGEVPPGVFIPVGERVGLIDDIGEFVRKSAYTWLLQCHAAGYDDLQMEVNVSPYHFRRGSVDRLLSEAREVGVDPRHIVLEITESALVGARGPAENLLDEVRKHGFGLAVDDFGTGYSSLAYLARLPVTVLKLAQEFVRGVDVEANRVVIETAVEIARRLGYQTIAEGVEQESEADYLRAAGVTAFQGYLYARPAPPDVAFDMLRRNRGGVGPSVSD